jgi:hypothetical protein
MKLAALALSALLFVPAHQALAQRGHDNDHGPRISINDIDGGDLVRPGPRHSLRNAHMAITTTDNTASFVMTREVVALQLTDRMLREVNREMDRDLNEEKGMFASMVANVVRGTVGTVLRRSLEIPIDELRTVDYRGGRLVFVTEDGDRIFENAEVNGTDLTASFSPREAQAFVREFRALKARTR